MQPHTPSLGVTEESRRLLGILVFLFGKWNITVFEAQKHDQNFPVSLNIAPWFAIGDPLTLNSKEPCRGGTQDIAKKSFTSR